MIDEKLHPFWPLREALHIQEGVIIYNDRVAIPPSLRKSALDMLHSAHQGVSAMEALFGQVLPMISRPHGKPSQSAVVMHPHNQPCQRYCQ